MAKAFYTAVICENSTLVLHVTLSDIRMCRRVSRVSRLAHYTIGHTIIGLPEVLTEIQNGGPRTADTCLYHNVCIEISTAVARRLKRALEPFGSIFYVSKCQSMCLEHYPVLVLLANGYMLTSCWGCGPDTFHPKNTQNKYVQIVSVICSFYCENSSGCLREYLNSSESQVYEKPFYFQVSSLHVSVRLSSRKTNISCCSGA